MLLWLLLSILSLLLLLLYFYFTEMTSRHVAASWSGSPRGENPPMRRQRRLPGQTGCVVAPVRLWLAGAGSVQSRPPPAAPPAASWLGRPPPPALRRWAEPSAWGQTQPGHRDLVSTPVSSLDPAGPVTYFFQVRSQTKINSFCLSGGLLNLKHVFHIENICMSSIIV